MDVIEWERRRGSGDVQDGRLEGYWLAARCIARTSELASMSAQCGSMCEIEFGLDTVRPNTSRDKPSPIPLNYLFVIFLSCAPIPMASSCPINSPNIQ